MSKVCISCMGILQHDNEKEVREWIVDSYGG